ncbi:MAG: DNA-processing protein DprA [Spirochaetia bacterium]|jgi:DNA processing protein
MKAARTIWPLNRVMDAQDRLSLLGLSHVEFLSPHEKLLLMEMLGSPARLFELPLGEIARLVGRKLTTRLWRPDDIRRFAEATSADLTREGLRSIFYWDSEYPPQLREIYDPPVTLFIRGSLPDNGDILAGIVGTRFPTGAGRAAAFRLGFDFGRNGICVVSGLARGIDREAHEGCEQAGGRSVAVLGNGIDLIYPASSRAAAMALLARGGAIVSEYPPGIPALRYHFPARNRIISGLCRGVVVVQAPDRSGALFTAEYSLDQGRDLWVHAAGLAGTVGAGTRRLAEAGAPVIRAAAEILSEWGVAPRAPEQGSPSAQLPAGERLAMMMKEEISGACAQRAGETYWRT